MSQIGKVLTDSLSDIKQTREKALKNAKSALLDAFAKKYGTDETNLNEIVEELENESVIKVNDVNVKLPKKRKNIFWRNLKYCYYNIWKQSEMATRLQKLAGITPPSSVATIILPNGIRVELKKLPTWYDVIRYQVCGFKLKIYKLEDK